MIVAFLEYYWNEWPKIQGNKNSFLLTILVFLFRIFLIEWFGRDVWMVTLKIRKESLDEYQYDRDRHAENWYKYFKKSNKNIN